MSTNKICIAICGYDSVPFDFIRELAKLIVGQKINMVLTKDLYIQRNRNMAVIEALKYPDWDYLLFIDTDMVLPGNLLKRVRQYKDPVVGGLYFRKQHPNFSPVPGKNLTGAAFSMLTSEEVKIMLDKPGMYPMDVLGTGCMAIRRDILENWPEDMKPWFSIMGSKDGLDVVGEDVYFCWRLKEQGYQAILDSNITCGHIGSVIIGKSTYLHAIAGQAKKTKK